MKPNQSIILVIIILGIDSSSLSAQKNHVGIDIGNGRATIEDYSRPFVNPFNGNLPYFFRIGLNYYYTPAKAIFNIKTGLTYDYKGHKDTRLNYLRIPIGLDFTIGDKIQLIFGGGFYAGYLISYAVINNQDFDDSVNKFQIGLQGNLGIGYKLSSRLNLRVVYQNNFDLTTLYEEWRISPGGVEYPVSQKGYDGFINVSLKYSLLSHKKPGTAKHK